MNKFFKSWFPQHCEGCRCFDTVAPEDEERELPLANEPDAQSPPHTHEWGLWKIVKEGTISKRGQWEYQDRDIGSYIDQQRRCNTCGKYELDTQVSYAIEED